MSAPVSKKVIAKKTTTEDANKARRDAQLLKIRKDKKEEGLMKRRNMIENLLEENESESPATASLSELSNYCTLARSSETASQLEGVRNIRRLLSTQNNPPVSTVLKSKILPRLVELLSSSDVQIQNESAWAITNIASSEYTYEVVDHGAISPLVACSMSADAALREQAIWCLGNIAGDCAKFRNMVINENGALGALLRNIQFPESLELLRNAAWTLSNVCRGKPYPSEEAIQFIVPALNYLLTVDDAAVQADAAWGISYLTDSPVRIIAHVVGELQPGKPTEVVQRLCNLMAHPDSSVATASLRCVANLIQGDDLHTQATIDAGALPKLVALMSHAKKGVRREACWALSNIAAGTPAQIQALLETPNAVQAVLHQLDVGETPVRKEACWVVLNLATNIPSCVRGMLDIGLADPLVSFLRHGDTRSHAVILDAIMKVLEVGRSSGYLKAVTDLFENAGLLDRLEDLQTYCHDDIYNKCIKIIEEFFSDDDECEVDNNANNNSAQSVDSSKLNSFSFTSMPTTPSNKAPVAAFNFGSINFA